MQEDVAVLLGCFCTSTSAWACNLCGFFLVCCGTLSFCALRCHTINRMLYMPHLITRHAPCCVLYHALHLSCLPDSLLLASVLPGISLAPFTSVFPSFVSQECGLLPLQACFANLFTRGAGGLIPSPGSSLSPLTRVCALSPSQSCFACSPYKRGLQVPT